MTPSIMKSLCKVISIHSIHEVERSCLPLPTLEAPTSSEFKYRIHKVTGEHTGNSTACMEYT